MNTVDEVMTELKKKGDEQTRKTHARHGAPSDSYGVKISELKLIAKKIKGNQQLACDLYESGNCDAKYLAGLVADGMKMSKKQLETWAQTANWGALSQFTVPWVAAESPYARELAMKWIRSKDEAIATSGWSTYAGLLSMKPDEELDLDEIDELLKHIEKNIHTAPNDVRYTMNAFVIAVGAYVKPLLKRAKAVAKAIGAVSCDMGDTACKIPLATAYIEKVENAGKVGKKRKTMKC